MKLTHLATIYNLESKQGIDKKYLNFTFIGKDNKEYLLSIKSEQENLWKRTYVYLVTEHKNKVITKVFENEVNTFADLQEKILKILNLLEFKDRKDFNIKENTKDSINSFENKKLTEKDIYDRIKKEFPNISNLSWDYYEILNYWDFYLDLRISFWYFKICGKTYKEHMMSFDPSIQVITHDNNWGKITVYKENFWSNILDKYISKDSSVNKIEFDYSFLGLEDLIKLLKKIIKEGWREIKKGVQEILKEKENQENKLKEEKRMKEERRQEKLKNKKKKLKSDSLIQIKHILLILLKIMLMNSIILFYQSVIDLI